MPSRLPSCALRPQIHLAIHAIRPWLRRRDKTDFPPFLLACAFLAFYASSTARLGLRLGFSLPREPAIDASAALLAGALALLFWAAVRCREMRGWRNSPEQALWEAERQRLLADLRRETEAAALEQAVRSVREAQAGEMERPRVFCVAKSPGGSAERDGKAFRRPARRI